MFELIPVKSDEQIRQLAGIAEVIWHECFPGIISEEQIDYMIEKFQSYKAMYAQMTDEGYQYYFITENKNIAGYTAIRNDSGDHGLFLSKLYILSDYRGHGLASKTIDRLTEHCKKHGLSRIWLTVNINNVRAISVYQHKGFRTVCDKKADIGNGFYMDDHIMALDIV